MSDEKLEQIAKAVAETHLEMKQGIICECGGIMHFSGSQMLVRTEHGLQDQMSIICERCGKTDKYIKPVKL